MAYQNEIYKVEWEFKKYTNADKLRYTGLLYLPLFAPFAAINSHSRMNIKYEEIHTKSFSLCKGWHRPVSITTFFRTIT